MTLSCPEILNAVWGRDGPQLFHGDPTRPYVTLTFAQSLDAKIAAKDGGQLILSGKEAMVMTHWMRTMHDAILVGIGTAINDDPQLNTRHLPPRPQEESTSDRPNGYHHPRPVILDSKLRLPLDRKLLKNYQEGRGRCPWIICSPPSLLDSSEHVEWEKRKNALQQAGAVIFEVSAVDRQLSISGVLQKLRELGISSVMVEGGANVIASFLAAASTSQPAVDAVIVTVAPTFVGGDGRAYHLGQIPSLQHVRTDVFGRDTVVAMKVGDGH